MGFLKGSAGPQPQLWRCLGLGTRVVCSRQLGCFGILGSLRRLYKRASFGSVMTVI